MSTFTESACPSKLISFLRKKIKINYRFIKTTTIYYSPPLKKALKYSLKGCNLNLYYNYNKKCSTQY